MNRGSCRLNDDRTSACTRIAPGVGGNVVDGVGRYLRRVDDDVAYERSVQECFVAEIMALVVRYDDTKIGVGVANVDSGGVGALDIYGWGLGYGVVVEAIVGTTLAGTIGGGAFSNCFG